MKSPSENKSPLLKTINDFMFLVKGLMLLVFVGFCFSGVTLVKPDEVAVVLRIGRLVGETRADQIHQPGWVLAFPQPIDEVVKIPVKQIREVKIRELAAVKKTEEIEYRTLDPVAEGYCVSGDENIFQVSMLVKYQISDPVAAVFNLSSVTFSSFESLISSLIVSEIVKFSCGQTIDGVLSESKEQLSLQVQQRTQKLLDQLESGITLISLELEEVSPPIFLQKDFEEVNTAFINRRNFINDARSLGEEKLPRARGQANELINQAEAYAQTTLAEAEANAGQFTQMLAAMQKNPEEVKMNMINEARKKLISATSKIVIVPAEKDCEASIRTFIGHQGGGISSLPIDSMQLYSEDD